MARTLKINVQVDRLPDIKVTKDQTEKAWCQLGLRLSAAIEPSKPPDADPTLRADADLLQPWLWRAKQDDGNGTWKVHAQENWTLWHWKEGVTTPQMIPTKDWKIVVTDPATFDPLVGTVRRFHQRISDAVAEILIEGGTRALEAPGADGVVAGRTVFGLTESLTGLPHPVLAGMQVWTAVSIDSAAVTIADTDRFLAAPSFVSPDNIAYQVKGAKTAADVPWEVPYTPHDASPLAVASVHASLPMKALQILEADEQKLIDLSTLLIRRGGSEFESSDWSTALPLRIAEAIDPAARAMAVLDNVIRALVAKEEKEAKASRSATRDALQADILPAGKVPTPDYLRSVLAALHRPILAPRARSSRPILAPAAALLERLAIANPTLWPAVAPLLFAHAGAEDHEHDPALAPHIVVTRERLADAAGVVPGRNDALSDGATASIDGEQAFRDWLLRHWTTVPGTAFTDNGSTYRFEGTTRRFSLKDDIVQSTDIRRIGVFDFMWLLPDVEKIELPLSVTQTELPTVVTFALRVPDAASPASIEVRLILDVGKTELSLAGANPATEPKTASGGHLFIGIGVIGIGVLVPKTGERKLVLDLLYKDKARWKLPLTQLSDGELIDITSLARAGRVGLSVTADKKIDVAIDPGIVSVESLRNANGSSGQGQSLRGALALAYAGPAVAGLMGGWVPIPGESADRARVAKPLRERLIETIGLYAPKAFTAAFKKAREIPIREAAWLMSEAETDKNEAKKRWDDAALQDKPDAEKEFRRLEAEFKRLKERWELLNKAGTGLKDLLDDLEKAATSDAQRLATELVPQKRPQADEPPTQDALPLIFVVDQLQDFDETVDLWTRLAGIGLLIGRQGSSKDDKDQWWSLNLASLHVSSDKNSVGVRDPLDKNNAIAVNGESDWPKNARVDPVPLVVGEISGVRGAVVRYESQSIVAEMKGRPQLDRQGQARKVARRSEAYLFPVGRGIESFRLPPLTFGRGYDIVPYLIGHGGALPPALRDNIEDPTSGRFASAASNGAITIARDRFVTPDGRDVIRSKASYLRTIPVGAPRMSPRSVWPGSIEDVAPLAAELPTRPPPITLHDKRPVRFFLDKEHTRGTLNSPPDVLATDGTVVEATGIRIEIEGIDVTRQWSDLVIRAETVDPAEQDAKLLLEVKVTRTEIAALVATDVGLRIDVMGNIAAIAALRSRAGDFAEDEPDEKPFTPATLPTVKKRVSAWQSFALVVKASGEDFFDVEPPSIRWGAQRGTAAFLPHGDRPTFPPEFVPSSRNIALLDGIGPGKRRLGPHKASIKLRRPSTTLATYDRWVNGPLSDYGDPTDSAKDTVRKALNASATRATTNLKRGTDRTLDDPAVEALVFEVVRLFPQRQVDQTLVVLDEKLSQISGLNAILGGTDGSLHGADKWTIEIELDGSKLEKATWEAGKLKLAAGCVSELRIYGAVPLGQPSFAPAGVTTRSRFAPAAIAGWREAKIDGTRWHLGAPLILTVEVASEIMPELYVEKADLDKCSEPDPMVFSMGLRRPPRVLRERAAMYLQPYLVGLPDPPVAATSAALVKYAALRHVDRLALFEQRWSWRGRPQAEIPAGEIKTFDPICKNLEEFVGTAFLGRSDDDIGTIHEMRITRAHAYGKRAVFEGSLPPFSIHIDELPAVLERDLDYRGGANLWRFAVRARSRYAAMRPNDPLLIRFSHRKDNKAKTLWSTFVVPDRAKPGADQRKPIRPGLMLVVPLTEPMMTGGSVPPLLALFNEPMFPLFHAGAGIEALIEVARHPFVGAEPSPPGDAVGTGGATPKYWPEYGPDPIRTGKGASGEPLALRCDGPVGYTFDIDTEAGRFDHTGLLVSPVIDTVRPWSLVKLRFRRLEAPEFLVDLGGNILVKTLSPPTNVDNPVRYRLSSDVPAAPEDDSSFATVHEGLAFEVDDLENALRLRLSFDDPKEITRDGKIVLAHHVRIVATIDRADPARPRLVLEGSTQLGRAADWAMNYDTGGKVQVRVVVSQRPRPGDDPYRPSDDVSVRVRIVRDDATDILQRAHENAWLSVICMPLTARDTVPPASGLLYVSSPEGPSTDVRVRPVRLSDFTPGVWCQFAAAMSRIVVEAELRTTGAPRRIKDTLTVAQLTAVKEDDSALRIGVSGLRNSESISTIAFTAVGEPDRHDPGGGRYGAQIEERLYALVTRYVYDAFDRLRERPVAVYLLADILSSPILRETTWPEGPSVKPYATGSGRVRILRVLRGRTRDQQGFEVTAKEFPGDFFGDAVESGGQISDEPLDSAGQVIGISVPFEWTSD